jgi:AcrR family transcriptional regulator
LRADAAATRRQLTDVVGQLLAERGREFGLAEVAARSGSSLATVYRHLGSVDRAIAAYLADLVDGWVVAVEHAADGLTGQARMRAVCQAWVRQADMWGPAAVWIRSPSGIVERYGARDPVVTANWRVLAPVVDEMVALGEIPPQPIEYAVLMWNTIFDERVILDLRRAAGWSSRRVARWLTESLWQVLSHPAGSGTARHTG